MPFRVRSIIVCLDSTRARWTGRGEQDRVSTSIPSGGGCLPSGGLGVRPPGGIPSELNPPADIKWVGELRVSTLREGLRIGHRAHSPAGTAGVQESEQLNVSLKSLKTVEERPRRTSLEARRGPWVRVDEFSEDSVLVGVSPGDLLCLDP